MFKEWFKRLKCEHDWHRIGEMKYEEWGSGRRISMTVVYCPKCDKETEVPNFRYEREQAKKRVRANVTNRRLRG